MRASSVADAAGDRSTATSRYCARSAVASKTTTPGVPSGTLSTRARKWGVTTTARISMPPEPSSAPSADHAVLATGDAARLTLIGGLAVLLAALMLAASLVGAYPLSLGEMLAAVGRRLTGAPPRGPDRHRAVRGAPAARVRRRAGRRGDRRGRRRLPDAVPQSAGVARHPRRLHRRRPRRRARHLPVAAGGRHPARGLRRWGSPPSASSTPSPRWCTGASRSWCWCWPAWWWARSPARPSRC